MVRYPLSIISRQLLVQSKNMVELNGYRLSIYQELIIYKQNAI